jgi:WD40 repeat protein
MEEDKKRAAKVDKANASSKKPRRQQEQEPLTATAADVFAKHPYLFVPFLDRVSLNRLFGTNKEIHAESQAVTLPWPEKRMQVGSIVLSVEFSPDGGLLASGCSNGRTCLWNRLNGRFTLLEGHHGDVRRVSFSPDGKFLASGSSGTARFDCGN